MCRSISGEKRGLQTVSIWSTGGRVQAAFSTYGRRNGKVRKQCGGWRITMRRPDCCLSRRKRCCAGAISRRRCCVLDIPSRKFYNELLGGESGNRLLRRVAMENAGRARGLSIETVAEEEETAEQVAFLKRTGWDEAQRVFFSRRVS